MSTRLPRRPARDRSSRSQPQPADDFGPSTSASRDTGSRSRGRAGIHPAGNRQSASQNTIQPQILTPRLDAATSAPAHAVPPRTAMEDVAAIYSLLQCSLPVTRGLALAGSWGGLVASSVLGMSWPRAGIAFRQVEAAFLCQLSEGAVRQLSPAVQEFCRVARQWVAKATDTLAQQRSSRVCSGGSLAGRPVDPLPQVEELAAIGRARGPAWISSVVGSDGGHSALPAESSAHPRATAARFPRGPALGLRGADGWCSIDHLSDLDALARPFRMVMLDEVPRMHREAWAAALLIVNARLLDAVDREDSAEIDRAGKWALLLPQLLLRKPHRGGARSQITLTWRFRAFERREMGALVRSWEADRDLCLHRGLSSALVSSQTATSLLSRAVPLIERGDLSRAGKLLTSHGLGDVSDPRVHAQLISKHPPRAMPIPEQLYSVPPPAPALTLDLSQTFAKLPHGSAAGPLGMRNEYLSVLVGAFAPESGAEAVENISAVWTMCAQGRLPGWLCRAWMSATLVAINKRRVESPTDIDVRPLAVGDALRRAAERAVLHAFTPAYRAALYPQQLAVGVSCGAEELIHGLRLLREKLGPRAVCVRIDLRNAYNMILRAIVILRHQEHPELAGLVVTLLTFLSPESFLMVNGHADVVTSAEGVQQGAPLSTAAFCLAIQPEVRMVDELLARHGGAARFMSDDGYLVGYPEDVWPALNRLAEALKTNTGCDLQLAKTMAYSEDMEGAMVGAPPGVQWPAIEGHHGMEVLNVPVFGDEIFIAASLARKGGEVSSHIRDVLAPLLNTAAGDHHHHAWAMLQHSLQHQVVYWLRNCLPSQVHAMAAGVDSAVCQAAEDILGVSFDESAYQCVDGESEEALVEGVSAAGVRRARTRLGLAARHRGGGLRSAVSLIHPAFLGAFMGVAPRFLDRLSGTGALETGGFQSQLHHVFGNGCFNAANAAERFAGLLRNDACSYGREFAASWQALQELTQDHVPNARNVLLLPAAGAYGSQRELTQLVEIAAMTRLDGELAQLLRRTRESHLHRQVDSISTQWVTAIPQPDTVLSREQLREVAARFFLLPSPALAPFVGHVINVPNSRGTQRLCDAFGDRLCTAQLPGAGYFGRAHDKLQGSIARTARGMGLPVEMEVEHGFQHCVPPERRHEATAAHLRGIIPDLGMALPQEDPSSIDGSGYSDLTRNCLLELKTLRYGNFYKQHVNAKAVDVRAGQLQGEAERALAAKDLEWSGTPVGTIGPMQARLRSAPYHGVVFGHMGEASAFVPRLAKAIAVHATRRARVRCSARTVEQQIALLQRQFLRTVGMAAVRANADLLLARVPWVAGAPPSRDALTGDRAAYEEAVGRAALVDPSLPPLGRWTMATVV
jgi:hypothetical protein